MRLHVARARAAAAVMGALLGCAGAGLPAWERPLPPIDESPVVPADRLHRSRLENGLDVLVLEDLRSPRLHIGLVARLGAGSEDPAVAGAAGFTTDLMERGAGERDALALAQAVEELGASLSAAAGWDSTRVSISGLSEDRDALFAILADVVRRPRFEPGEIDRLRAERLAAFEQQKDDPSSLVTKHLERALYPDHRYGIASEGEPATVAALDAESVRTAYRRIFQPGNSILYVVGDIRGDAARAHAAAHFSDWPSGPVSSPGPAPPARTPPRTRVVVVDRPDLSQSQLALAHEGLARTDPTRLEAALANSVLGGGGFLSRLMTRLRADEGLTYGVGSGFSMRRHPGPFRVRTSTRVEETGRVVGMILEEMARLKTEPPTEQELSNAKTYSAGSFALSLETSAAIANSLVDLDVYGLSPDLLDTYRGRIRAMPAEAVARAARERFHPDRLVVLVVGPADALVSQLEPFGPVQVVQP